MLKAQSRMTITPTMVHGGVKSNSVPESINLTCDVRTLPHQDQIYLEEELAKIFKGINGLDFTIDYMAIPNSSPYETSFIDTLKDVTQRIVDRSNLQWVPAVCSGFTDSRFTRNLGVETYGFMGAHHDDYQIVIPMMSPENHSGFRISLQGYNSESDVEYFIQTLKKFI